MLLNYNAGLSEARTAIWFQESVPLIPSTLFFLPTLSHCQEICYEKKAMANSPRFASPILSNCRVHTSGLALLSTESMDSFTQIEMPVHQCTCYMATEEAKKHFHIDVKVSTVQAWLKSSISKWQSREPQMRTQNFLTILNVSFLTNIS